MKKTDWDYVLELRQPAPIRVEEGLEHWDAACEKALDALEEIQRGSRTLEAVDPYSYIWGEWVGDITFDDDTHLLEDVCNACSLVNQCTSAERYDLVLSLGQKLLELQVQTDDTSGGFDELDLNQLGIVKDLPVRTVVLDMMQAVYHIGAHPQEAIRALMDYPNYQKMRLKEMLDAMGEVPEDFPNFLQGWLEMLSQKTDAYSQTLTEEAIQILPDLEVQLACCRSCVEKNPQLYLTVVTNQSFSSEQRYQAAVDGVQRIPENYKVRGAVALEVAGLAAELNLPRKNIETHWREAFCSDTSPLNYLRLLLHSEDLDSARAWLDDVLERPLPDWTYRRGEPDLNYKSTSRTFLFRLLKGDFQAMVKPDVWSSSAFTNAMTVFAILFQGEPKSRLMKQAEESAIFN